MTRERVIDYTCPRCGAKPGEGCVTRSGNPSVPHMPRWDVLWATGVIRRQCKRLERLGVSAGPISDALELLP